MLDAYHERHDKRRNNLAQVLRLRVRREAFARVLDRWRLETDARHRHTHDRDLNAHVAIESNEELLVSQ